MYYFSFMPQYLVFIWNLLYFSPLCLWEPAATVQSWYQCSEWTWKCAFTLCLFLGSRSSSRGEKSVWMGNKVWTSVAYFGTLLSQPNLWVFECIWHSKWTVPIWQPSRELIVATFSFQDLVASGALVSICNKYGEMPVDKAKAPLRELLRGLFPTT